MSDARVYRPDDDSNPVHYRKHDRECIDEMPDHFMHFLREQGLTDGRHIEKMMLYMMLGFTLGNAFKYRWRAGLKASASHASDLTKALWYTRFANFLQGNGLDPRSLASVFSNDKGSVK